MVQPQLGTTPSPAGPSPFPSPIGRGVKCEIPLWEGRLTPKRFSKDRERGLTLVFSKVGEVALLREGGLKCKYLFDNLIA